MRIRLLLGALLICGLMAADGATVAGAAPKRVYKGKTGQRRQVRLAVLGHSLKLLHFKANLRCRNGVRLIVDESGFLRTPLRGGSFHDLQVGSTDEVFFHGRVRGGDVRGKIRVKDRLSKHGARCASHWIGFRARRG